MGQAIFWHNVFITTQQYGPVHVAIARHPGSKEFWIVVSSEPTSMTTFAEYGLRFDIEENFLDDKSNGSQLEASLIRSADALSRLCFVLAITTLYLVSQGTVVVEQGKRRWVVTRTGFAGIASQDWLELDQERSESRLGIDHPVVPARWP